MAKRQKNGEGSVSRDESGIYHCYLQTNVVNQNGNYVRVHGQGINEAEARKDAKKKKTIKERERDLKLNDNANFSKRLTFGSYMQDFMIEKNEKGFKGKKITDSTYTAYTLALKACFYNHKISKLQPKQLMISDFKEFYEYLDKKYPNNVHRRKEVRGYCINCLEWLNTKGFNLNVEIASVPQIQVPQLDAISEQNIKEFKDMMFLEDNEKQCLTEEELKRLEQAHEDRFCKYTACFLLQCSLGLRFGELAALQESDLDREKRILYIYKSVGRRLKDRTGGKTTRETYLKCTKNADKRIVFVDDYALGLWDYQVAFNKRKAKVNPHNLIMCSWENGNYVKGDSYNDSLKNMAHKYHIELPKNHCSHIFRKTYATYNSLSVSVNPLLLAKSTGHRDMDVLFNAYIKPTISQLSTIQSPFKILQDRYNETLEITKEVARDDED